MRKAPAQYNTETPESLRPTTPQQVWDELDVGNCLAKVNYYWPFRMTLNRCKQINPSIVLVGEGFSPWFWSNVPRLFENASVVPEDAPAISALLVQLRGSYGETARQFMKKHRRASLKWTDLDRRLMVDIALLVMTWMVAELSEEEQAIFDSMGPV